jgi:hypothetical protein
MNAAEICFDGTQWAATRWPGGQRLDDADWEEFAKRDLLNRSIVILEKHRKLPAAKMMDLQSLVWSADRAIGMKFLDVENDELLMVDVFGELEDSGSPGIILIHQDELEPLCGISVEGRRAFLEAKRLHGNGRVFQ